MGSGNSPQICVDVGGCRAQGPHCKRLSMLDQGWIFLHGVMDLSTPQNQCWSQGGAGGDDFISNILCLTAPGCALLTAAGVPECP